MKTRFDKYLSIGEHRLAYVPIIHGARMTNAHVLVRENSYIDESGIALHTHRSHTCTGRLRTKLFKRKCTFFLVSVLCVDTFIALNGYLLRDWHLMPNSIYMQRIAISIMLNKCIL